MHRPTTLIMDIEDIRVKFERLSPRLSREDIQGAAGQTNIHQIELEIENFVASFKQTCPDWDRHFTRVTSGYSLNQTAVGSSLGSPAESVCSPSESDKSLGTYSSGLTSLSASQQNLLLICSPVFLNLPQFGTTLQLLNPGKDILLCFLEAVLSITQGHGSRGGGQGGQLPPQLFVSMEWICLCPP